MAAPSPNSHSGISPLLGTQLRAGARKAFGDRHPPQVPCRDRVIPVAPLMRFQLQGNLYQCSAAQAELVSDASSSGGSGGSNPNNCACQLVGTGQTITVVDAVGLVSWLLIGKVDGNGNWYIPSGAYGYGLPGGQNGEIFALEFGLGQCPGSSGSSGSSGPPNCPAATLLASVTAAPTGVTPSQVLAQGSDDCPHWFPVSPCAAGGSSGGS